MLLSDQLLAWSDANSEADLVNRVETRVKAWKRRCDAALFTHGEELSRR